MLLVLLLLSITVYRYYHPLQSYWLIWIWTSQNKILQLMSYSRRLVCIIMSRTVLLYHYKPISSSSSSVEESCFVMFKFISVNSFEEDDNSDKQWLITKEEPVAFKETLQLVCCNLFLLCYKSLVITIIILLNAIDWYVLVHYRTRFVNWCDTCGDWFVWAEQSSHSITQEVQA